MKYLCLMVAALTITSCAGIDLDTSEKRYLASRAELNLFLEQYIDIQAKVDPATHEKIRTAFYHADAVLDIWEIGMGKDPSYDFASDYNSWLEIKSEILSILREVYGGG